MLTSNIAYSGRSTGPTGAVMDGLQKDGVTVLVLNEDERTTFQKALEHARRHTEDEAEAQTIAAAAAFLERMAKSRG